MKKHDLVILSLKLLGIYITIQGISSISMSFGVNGFSGLDSWSLHFGVFVFLASGLCLIFKADTLSKYILPDDGSTIENLELSEGFQKAALRIMGVYVAVFSIPSLSHIIGQMVESGFIGTEIPDHVRETPSYIVPFVSQLIRFLIGLFLALGPSSVIKALGRFDKTIEKLGT